MPEHIDPAAIPGKDLDPDTIETAANQIRTIGADIATNGGTVLTSWQGISAHYVAPESETLFGVMDPVKTLAEGVGADISAARNALTTFAEEVRPIKAELDRIRAEAVSFVASIQGGVDVEVPIYAGRGGYAGTRTENKAWHEDQDTVDKNNELINRVSDQMVLLWAAERACANAIYDIIGYPHIEAATDANPNGYGVEEIPDEAETPWGTPVEKSEDCGEKVVGAVKGFVWDGVIVGGIWGTVTGLGSLVLGYNPATGEWFQGDVYAAGWSNMGMLAVGLVTASPGGAALSFVPGPVGDFVRGGQEALLNAGKGIIAYDQWEEDPAAAAGTAVFNVATIVIPAGAAISGVKAGAGTTAAAIRNAAIVVDFVDPAALAVRTGVSGLRIAAPAISDLLKGVDLGSLTRGADDVPAVTIPHFDAPTTSFDIPTGAYDLPPVREVPATVPEPALVGAGGPGSGAGGLDVPAGSTQVGGGTSTVDPVVTGSGGGGGTTDAPIGGSGAVDDGAVPPPEVPSGGSTVPDPPREWTPDDGDPALSDADHGPGWERGPETRGNPVDPAYGQPLPDHGVLADQFAPPETLPEAVRDLVTDPGAPYGRDDAGQPYTREEWQERYIGPDNRPVYPGNDGAVPGTRIEFVDPDEFMAHYGDLTDRMGGDGGDFLSFPDTPFEARALPGSNLNAPYSTFRFSGEIPEGIRIEVSEVAPAFGQPGGGLQVRFLDEAGDTLSVADMLDPDIGILQRVDDGAQIDSVGVIDDAVDGVDGSDAAVAAAHATDSSTAGASAPPSAAERFPAPEVANRVDVAGSDVPGPRTAFAARTDLDPNTVYVVEGRGTFTTNADGRVVHVETTYGGNGSLNPDLINPRPDATYVVNDHHVFVTDAEARTVEVHVEGLTIEDAYRSDSIQSRIGDLGGDGYDGGHLLSNATGGGAEDINVVAMLAEINRGSGDSFFNLENKLRSLISGDPPAAVDLHIYPEYGAGQVPSRFSVEYSIDGVWDVTVFDNVK
jgi:hypothetical protein